MGNGQGRIDESLRECEKSGNKKIGRFSKKVLQFLTTKKEAGSKPNVHYKKDCATSIILPFL